MKRHTIIVILVLLVTCLLSLFIKSIEHFDVIPSATRERCPTRNQSFDIRGDIPIPKKEMIFNNSAFGPLFPEECQNKPLV